MKLSEQVKKEEQKIARLEQRLAEEKLKKRKLDARRKIELGGLVIKSGIDGLSKAIILGPLTHSLQLIHQDETYKTLFESLGEKLFLES